MLAVLSWSWAFNTRLVLLSIMTCFQVKTKMCCCGNNIYATTYNTICHLLLGHLHAVTEAGL